MKMFPTWAKILTVVRHEDWTEKKTCYYPNDTVKFRKYDPGLIFFKGPFWRAYFWRGLCTEGNLRFKIDYASLWLKGNLPFFLSFTLYLRALFSSTSPGGLYAEGTLNGGFFALRVWGAYFRNFTVLWSFWSWRNAYLSPKNDQHQITVNSINISSRWKVIKNNKMIAKGELLWSFIKFFQLIP